MKFLGKINQNNRLAPPPLGLAPPPSGNPGSATVKYASRDLRWDPDPSQYSSYVALETLLCSVGEISENFFVPLPNKILDPLLVCKLLKCKTN